jgi:uroporphyrinogen-III synthase
VADFAGLKVAAFESRMAEDMARLIRRYGGEPHVAPSLRETPLEDHHPIFAFAARLLAGELDMVIFLTGVGVRYLMEVLEGRQNLEAVKGALAKTTLVARGPKPIAALKEFGLAAAVSVPEPNTWRDVLQALDTTRNLSGLRIAVQEYGATNPELLQALRDRGAEVMPVPVYRWSLPENPRPLQKLLEAICAGRMDVLLITNAVQAENVMALLDQMGQTAAFRQALARMAVASIGPTATEHLHHHELPVDLEPSHPKMGHLVKEMSERAQALLALKRS